MSDAKRKPLELIFAGLVLLQSSCLADTPRSPAREGVQPVLSEFPNMVVEHNVPVPMRDGIVLRADVYRPNTGGKFPTLVYRTPYGKDGLLEGGGEPTVSRAPREGYALVVQDVRGRYHSEGEFLPYHQEGVDGYDTIEWAAAQSWSNGRVGTFGRSYRGAVQWLAAMEAPPHLVSILPSMTFASGRHFFYHGGAWDHSWLYWIMVNIAPDIRRREGLPGPNNWQDARKAWDRLKWEWMEYVPLVDLPELRQIAPWYYDWLRHPDDGPYWAFADVTAAHERIKVPALNFSGWYDNNYGPLGAIANFTGMRKNGATAKARRGQRLIMGPWDHGDPQENETGVTELDFGPNATFDYYGLVFRWHDRWLKEGHGAPDSEPPVRIFVMGENVWRDEWEWPLERTQYVSYYLRSGGLANKATGDGRLSIETPPVDEPADRYDYDPREPLIIEGFERGGPFDHAEIQERQDVLVYSTPPLEEDLEITGPITATLWISSSASDTDFGVMLLDVHPDGKAYNIIPMEAGYLRARYRNSEAEAELLTPGEPTELSISGMVTSNLFRKGHRVRVLISSSRFPVFDRNPNTGEPFGTSDRMVTAQQTILHDAAHPSRFTLPVIPR